MINNINRYKYMYNSNLYISHTMYTIQIYPFMCPFHFVTVSYIYIYNCIYTLYIDPFGVYISTASILSQLGFIITIWTALCYIFKYDIFNSITINSYFINFLLLHLHINLLHSRLPKVFKILHCFMSAHNFILF